MVSLVALALMSAPLQPPKVLGRVIALDPCYINGVEFRQEQMPQTIQTGLGGQTVELFRGTARLRIENANGGQIGTIVLVSGTKVNFKKNVLLFPVGFTLNWGTIDCESNPNDCQISVNAGTCSIVTTGTHFQVERTKTDVKVDVYEGSVNITPENSITFPLLRGFKGSIGRTTNGGTGFNYGWLTSKEKQDHKNGPAHIR